MDSQATSVGEEKNTYNKTANKEANSFENKYYEIQHATCNVKTVISEKIDYRKRIQNYTAKIKKMHLIEKYYQCVKGLCY